MTGAMLLLLVVPLTLAVSTIVEYADDIVGWARPRRPWACRPRPSGSPAGRAGDLGALLVHFLLPS
jgi:hypothetical protein